MGSRAVSGLLINDYYIRSDCKQHRSVMKVPGKIVTVQRVVSIYEVARAACKCNLQVTSKAICCCLEPKMTVSCLAVLLILGDFSDGLSRRLPASTVHNQRLHV